jgi:hypothetical protein
MESYTIKLAPTASRVTVNPSKSDGVAITGNQRISADWNPWNEADRESASTASSIQVEYSDDTVRLSELGDIITLRVIACHQSRSLLGRTQVYRSDILSFKAKVVRKGCDVEHLLMVHSDNAVITDHNHYIGVEVIQDADV